MDFYEKTGKMALGSRLRRLSEQVTEQAASIYDLYEVDLQPKWFPVFYALSEGEEKSITDIAREIGHTHPSVSQIVREMAAKGYILETKGGTDRREVMVEKENMGGDGPENRVGKRAGGKEDKRPADDGVDKQMQNRMGLKRAMDSAENRRPVENTGSKRTMDGRKNFVVLTEAGRKVREKMRYQLEDVTTAIEKVMKESQYDLWKAIGEWEFLLGQKSLLKRVQEEKKLRESHDVQIVDYEPKHAKAFHDLNEEWITTWFKMEEEDHHALDHPKEHILDGGGHIYIALYKGEVVGTCAIIKMRDGGFELAKMAVSPKAKGKGIGWLLGRACIEKARELGGTRVYLESNTRLKPAINLYHKLGFRKIAGPPSPYERCDIQMELMFQ